MEGGTVTVYCVRFSGSKWTGIENVVCILVTLATYVLARPWLNQITNNFLQAIAFMLGMPLVFFLVYQAWELTLDSWFRIEMLDDGTLTILNGFGPLMLFSKMKRIRSGDIVAVEKFWESIPLDGEGHSQFRLRHSEGIIVLPYFRRVETFLEKLTLMNPAIQIKGEWDRQG